MMRTGMPLKVPGIALLALFLSVAPVLASDQNQWPTYHGPTSLRGAADVSLPEAPALLWRYRAGDSVNLTPVSGGGRIYIISGIRVAGLDREGKLLWSRIIQAPDAAGSPPSPESFRAPAVFTDGVLLAGSSSGILYALDASTGQEIWRYNLGGPITGSPSPVGSGGKNSVIVISQSDGSLHRISLESGKREWKTGKINRCDGSAAVSGGVIAFGNCDSAVYAYDVASGSRVNRVDLYRDGQVYSGVAFGDKKVYAGDRSGRLYAVDIADGKITWVNEEGGGEISSTPAVNDGNLVYTSDDGQVVGLNSLTGERKWSFDSEGKPSSPVIARDKVVVSSEGTLYILDLDTGKVLWSRHVSDTITSPALIDGMIVVGTEEGTVVAFGEGDNS